MANKYCDHGVYGAYAATPTWGTPQEGDGTASTASTAAATISLDCSGYTFTSGSSTISVMGATAITMTASATSGTNAQYSATLTTMLDNIVSAINQCTATIVNKPTNWQAGQVRNMVFARRTGNSLELMTRTGSASWNSLIGVAWANVTGASSGTWANGVGGCWGYITNNSATIWASAIAIVGYGIMAPQMPYAGILDAGDVVKIRAAKTLTFPTNTSPYITPAVMGSALAPVVFEVDDGTVWSADGSTPVLTFTIAVTNTYGFYIYPTALTHVHVKGKEYAGGAKNFVIEVTGTMGGQYYPCIRINANGDNVFEDIEFTCPVAGGCPSVINQGNSCYAYSGTTFLNCIFEFSGEYRAVLLGAMGNYVKIRFTGCKFVSVGATTASTGIMTAMGVGGCSVVFESCTFTGFVSGSRLFASGGMGTLYSGTVYRFSNCSLGNINNWGPANLAAPTASDHGAAATGLIVASQFGQREFAVDSFGRAYSEWNSAAGRPYLNAVLHDGVTPWQIYMVPAISAGGVSRANPVEFPPLRKLMPAAGDLAEAQRTITLNFLLESTLSAWTKQDVSVKCRYIDTSGNITVVDSYDKDGGALTTSSEAWSTTSWNGQTWLKRQLSITTPTAVESETEVSFIVSIHSHVPNDTIGIIVDPELVVA